MSADNGSGNGGGNSSVFWEVRGSRVDTARPTLKNKVVLGVAASSAGGAAAIRPAGIGSQMDPDVVDAELEDVLEHPSAGEIKIGKNGHGESHVQGHDRSFFDRIGMPDHKGKFRVSLRFRKEDLENPQKVDPKFRAWIEANYQVLQELNGLPEDTSSWKEGDIYLVLDVPAIIRKPMPENGEPWQDMPWEIHWEW